MRTRRLTLAMPEDLIRRAKVLAAGRGISVSALVAELLEQATRSVTADEQAWAAEEALMSAGIGLRVGEIDWSRDDLHGR